MKKACRGFKRHLLEMLVGDAKVGDLMDVEELLGCRKKLRSRREHHAAAASFMSLARLVHGLHAWLPMGGGASEDGSPTVTYGEHLPTTKMGVGAFEIDRKSVV